MCFHASVVTPKGKVEERFNRAFKPGVDFDPLYHTSGFAHEELPIVGNENQIQLASWGLIPRWVKSLEDALKIRNQTLNARSETVFEKPSFRNSISKGRCLVPVTGFFEWRSVGKHKFPYHISHKEEELFSLAGITEEWLNKETGEIMKTVSILTTSANPMMQIIHNEKLRMPVIIDRNREEEWIDPSLQQKQIELFFEPSKAPMIAKSISKLITSNANSNVPDILTPHYYTEVDTILDSEHLATKPTEKPKVIQDSLFGQ